MKIKIIDLIKDKQEWKNLGEFILWSMEKAHKTNNLATIVILDRIYELITRVIEIEVEIYEEKRETDYI